MIRSRHLLTPTGVHARLAAEAGENVEAAVAPVRRHATF